MAEKFKPHVIYLLPVLASLLFGLGCGALFLTRPVPPITVTPFPEETTVGLFGNAAYFVVLVAISATIFYVLLKRQNLKVITLIIALALTAAAFLLSIIYLSLLFALAAGSEFLVWPISIVTTALFDLAVFHFGGKARNIAVICLGGAVGAFFGNYVPFLSATLILIFLAIYDVFAVYYGPVGKIAHLGLHQLHGLSYSFKDMQMGLGDLVFYSMLATSMLFNFGATACISSLAGIIAGAYLTLMILEKKGMFPGLPFPILLGLISGLLTFLLL
ncbi:MAG: presenilin [Candidatus Bathyarchaeota archaeon]|nr:presenilin [Candidatus Bathyarchaeota archaeon]